MEVIPVTSVQDAKGPGWWVARTSNLQLVLRKTKTVQEEAKLEK